MKNARIIMKGPSLFIAQEGNTRICRSKFYNYNMDMETGKFARWGITPEHDPKAGPFPEILDIEVTTNCNGPANKLCGFCYKNNNPNGYNMPLADFKNIIDKMPFLTQCALGADAQGITNPDLFDMMAYARSKGIIPNLTIADVSKEIAGKLASVAGAVAVSVYKHAGFDVAFDSVKNLSDAGQKQINLHFMISNKTIDDAYKVTEAMKNDPRLANVNAIVFLGLKQKGRGVKYEGVTREQYRQLVDHCLTNQIPFGFDSCSAPAFIDSVRDHENYEMFKMMAEDCESTLFSSYINERGVFFPCSFTENWTEGGWAEGINVLESENFIRDVWNHEKTVEFRKNLIDNTDCNGCRNCPAYAVAGKDMRLYKESVGDII